MKTRPANSSTRTRLLLQHKNGIAALHLPLFAWPFGLWIGSRWFMKEWVWRGKRENKWRFIWSSGLNSRCEREKTRLDATSAQCSQSPSVYLIQKAAGWHFSLPGACVLDCAFVCGLKSTGNVCVFRVFAPVYLSLSRYSCRSDTQWRAAVPPHFNMAERPPHVYLRAYSATPRLGGGGGCVCVCVCVCVCARVRVCVRGKDMFFYSIFYIIQITCCPYTLFHPSGGKDIYTFVLAVVLVLYCGATHKKLDIGYRTFLYPNVTI